MLKINTNGGFEYLQKVDVDNGYSNHSVDCIDTGAHSTSQLSYHIHELHK